MNKMVFNLLSLALVHLTATECFYSKYLKVSLKSLSCKLFRYDPHLLSHQVFKEEFLCTKEDGKVKFWYMEISLKIYTSYLFIWNTAAHIISCYLMLFWRTLNLSEN